MNKVEEYLTGEYRYTSDDLNASGTVYTVNASVPQPYIKIMAYRNAVVVCTSQNISLAMRSGYLPAWVDTYGTVLDGSPMYSEILDNLTATFLRNW